MHTRHVMQIMECASKALNAQGSALFKTQLLEMGYSWAEMDRRIDLQNVTNFAKD